MMTLNLGTDFFHVIRHNSVWTIGESNKVLLPTGMWTADYNAYFKDMPKIADVYAEMLRQGWDNDRIIRKLIEVYMPIKLFTAGPYENTSLCIGFIGARGGGKSASAVLCIIFDHLIRGQPVWSNIPIEVRVVYKNAEKIFRSFPLDQLDMLNLAEGYEKGVVFLDEVNMEAAESSKHMSNANLQFSYALQQIRKRKLTVYYTVQGWMWIDNRLRWQTDFAVSCRDAFTNRRAGARYPGELTLWTVYDLSGTSGRYDVDYYSKNRYLTDFPVWNGRVCIHIVWDAYSTDKLFGQENYTQKYKESLKPGVIADERYSLPGPKQRPALELAQELINAGAESFYASQIWQANDITDRATQTIIGQALTRAGYIKKRDSHGYFYELQNIAEKGA